MLSLLAACDDKFSVLFGVRSLPGADAEEQRHQPHRSVWCRFLLSLLGGRLCGGKLQCLQASPQPLTYTKISTFLYKIPVIAVVPPCWIVPFILLLRKSIFCHSAWLKTRVPEACLAKNLLMQAQNCCCAGDQQAQRRQAVAVGERCRRQFCCQRGQRRANWQGHHAQDPHQGAHHLRVPRVHHDDCPIQSCTSTVQS